MAAAGRIAGYVVQILDPECQPGQRALGRRPHGDRRVVNEGIADHRSNARRQTPAFITRRASGIGVPEPRKPGLAFWLEGACVLHRGTPVLGANWSIAA